MLFISTVSYSVKVYGSDTEAENILSLVVGIGGEDGKETKFKRFTNKATEGYELFIMSSAELAGPRSGGGRPRGLSSHLFVDKTRGLV